MLAVAVVLAGILSVRLLGSRVVPTGVELDGGIEPGTPEAGLHGPRALQGLVQDDRDQPLAQALVRVSSPEYAGELRDVKTDASGHFRLADLPAAGLRVEVSRAGHEGRVVTLSARDDATLTFVLARQGELHVALRDTPGNPVDDAEIVITGPGLWPAQAARADAKGEALFVGLAAGEYNVRARRARRVAIGALSAIVPGQRTEAELTLGEGPTLKGSVVDAQSQKPLANARVSVQDLTPGLDASDVTTDAQGSFTASGLWPGAARIDVQRDGYAPLGRELELPARAPLVIALEGAAALGGVVVDEAGKPIAGAQLSVSTGEGLPIDLSGPREGELGVTQGPVPQVPRASSPEFALGTFAAESDAAGAFQIVRLAPQPLVLHVLRPGYLSERVNIDDLAPHAEKKDVRVVLRAAGRIVGKVTDARGVGLQAVYVLAHGGEREQSTLTSSDGEYTLRDLLGEVAVEAMPDGRTTLRCKLQLKANEEARCDLTADSALHTLQLRVVDAYGNALEGARVVVNAAKGVAENGFSRPDGTLSIGELPPPPYKVDVSLAGYLELDDLPVDGSEKELRIQLGRAATLGGVVVDVLGRAVAGAFVSTEEGESSGETDSAGGFSLHGVPPGPHLLVAHHASAGDGRSAEIRARASERLDGIRIALKGRYQSDSDAGLPRVREARPSDFGMEARGRVFVVTQVAANGLANKAGLRVGDVLSAVDGEPPLSIAHARGMLRDPPGRAATVRVLRDRRPINLRYKRPAL
ncbi:MAG TPA: carboxypeptidase regulatory-like domain-containing protein [Polyangiales bacterium]|nr:carboxypeptidase regulatory-like domain-containing protein [Polyangiales bacterium]